MRYFLGVDVGGTKTAALIADENGRAVQHGLAGTGNYESVGWDGFKASVRSATEQALGLADLTMADLAGAGMGIAGYDWPFQKQMHLDALAEIGFRMPIEIVNDAVLGILAGARDGWGVSVVSGTGCNCRGWSRNHRREGRVVGGAPMWSGEYAGGFDILARAMRAVTYQWARRGPETALSQAFIDHAGAEDLDDLIEGLYVGRYTFDADLLLLVFEIASQGDPQAIEALRWAGRELGHMACGVIRQLNMEADAFDVVLIGSVFKGHPLISEALGELVRQTAPAARLAALQAPPVVGGVLLGMEQVMGKAQAMQRRAELLATTQDLSFVIPAEV